MGATGEGVGRETAWPKYFTTKEHISQYDIVGLC